MGASWRRKCQVCQESKAHGHFKEGDNVCHGCGGGTAIKCSRCNFWWPIGGVIQADDLVCSLCIEKHGGLEKILGNEHVVYFVQAGDFVKIGVTIRDRVRSRISQLQTGNPVPLELRAIERGSVRRERELHRKFEDYRANGEWFRLEGDLAAHVDALEKG